MKDNNLYTPDHDYSKEAKRRIRKLRPGSLVLFDVEGTALSSTNPPKVRRDFHEVYKWTRKNRADLIVGTITYRSRDTGIPELEEYDFDGNWFKEDILETMGRPDRIGFIREVFGDEPSKVFLIDDSPDGLEAQKQRFGLKVR